VSDVGGDLVSLMCGCGSTFDATTAVFIDGVPVDRTLVSACELEIVTPPLMIGEHTIEICDQWGCRIFAGAIRATDCSQTNMALCIIGTGAGPRWGESITIEGCGLPTQGSPITVLFGSEFATSIAWISSTLISMNVPLAACTGFVDVTLIGPSTQTTTRRGYEYLPVFGDPILSTVSPNTGPVAGGDAVTLTGTDFAPGSFVYFGSQQASVQNVSATQIDCTTPPVAGPGRVDVIVEDPVTGCRSILECAYEYLP